MRWKGLSISTRIIGATPELTASVEEDLRHIPEFEPRFLRLNAQEPYRLKATAIVHRLAFTRDRHARGGPHIEHRDYADTAELIKDLTLMRDSLFAHKGELIATGLLERTIRTVWQPMQTFQAFFFSLSVFILTSPQSKLFFTLIIFRHIIPN